MGELKRPIAYFSLRQWTGWLGESFEQRGRLRRGERGTFPSRGEGSTAGWPAARANASRHGKKFALVPRLRRDFEKIREALEYKNRPIRQD